jgi:hypothetical protein
MLIRVSARMPRDMRGTVMTTVSRLAWLEMIHDTSQNITEISRWFGSLGFADADLRPS